MSRPVSEEVHPDAVKRIERTLNEAFDEALERAGYGRRYAGPAYNAIEVHGFNVDPRDPTRTRVPNIKFPGTDAQFQEVLDKSNATTARKLRARRDKLEVKLYKLEVKIRKAEALKLREMETRLLNLETLARDWSKP